MEELCVTKHLDMFMDKCPKTLRVCSIMIIRMQQSGLLSLDVRGGLNNQRECVVNAIIAIDDMENITIPKKPATLPKRIAVNGQAHDGAEKDGAEKDTEMEDEAVMV